MNNPRKVTILAVGERLAATKQIAQMPCLRQRFSHATTRTIIAQTIADMLTTRESC